LQDKLNQVVASDGDIDTAVSVVDLDTNQQYDAGDTGTVFKAASTAKLIAIVDYLHEVEEGKATLDQDIDGTPAQTLIQQMLEVSDNNAWNSINNYLGDDQQTYANSIGLTSFTGDGYNTITAHDEAKLLAMLYEGKLINSAHRSLMYQYMEVADGTSLIKAALPPDATVYHKYGLLTFDGDTYLNDTAIVTYKGHHFALVIYTESTNSDTFEQTDLIHSLTKTVVDNLND
jgi:beta-lactamase class A